MLHQPAPVPTPRSPAKKPVPGFLRLDDLARADIIRFGAQIAQLVLLLQVVRLFQIESAAFPDLLTLALVGFVVHHFLPLPLRMPFFALLSVASIVLLLGSVNAAWLVGMGALLIGLAHLPVRFGLRVVLILTAGGAAALLHANVLQGPVSGAVWPIFGSMFMFRMIAYLYDLRHRAAAFGPWKSFAYFFMIPNVAFPLFPVVDYKAFVRSHYNDRSLVIYQSGLTWMMRGTIQLILYRLVYQNLLVDPAGVEDSLGAARYMLATYLLYLKVSGTFHVIVGMLHLFGFNLSETHHKYLLASSFTDFWRRINIYWKNFIEKLFFKPAFFWFGRRTGRNGAMIGATAIAFLATWILHSYQWFWIRGEFPMTWQDAVFWWILGALVVATLFHELKSTATRRLKETALTPGAALRKALATMGVFGAIVILWSLWSAGSLAELRHLVVSLLRITPTGAAWIAAVLAVVGVAAVVSGRSRQAQTDLAPSAAREAQGGFWRPALTNCVILGALFSIGYKPTLLGAESQLVEVVSRVKQRSQLSTKDRKVLERGYYEDLTNVGRFSPELAALYGQEPPDWAETDALVTDPTQYPHVSWRPSMRSRFRGAEITTNRWAMRDREYTLEKPEGVVRLALIGSSHSAGSGVADEEIYENLIEERLNRERGPEDPAYEILNFSVGGYGAVTKLAALEQKILRFEPDLVVFELTSEYERIVQNVTRALAGGSPVPYDFVTAAAAAEGIDASTPRITMINRMLPRAPDLLRASLARADSLCRAAGARLVVIAIPETSEPTEANLRSWRGAGGIAHDLGIPFLDATGAYRGEKNMEDLWVAPWDRHPDARGHRLLADTLYPLLLEALEAGASGT